jgi:hypothetical protein
MNTNTNLGNDSLVNINNLMSETETVNKVNKVEKVKVITFVSELEKVIKKGGSWNTLVKNGFIKKCELEQLTNKKIEFTGKSKILSLINYRMNVQNKVDYLGKKKVTEQGIF